MLVKKYLNEIPLCESKFTKKPDNRKTEYVFSKIDVSKAYGEILTVDFYSENRELKRRFFTDGKNWITLEKGSWHYRNIVKERLCYPDYIESNESISRAEEYFKKHGYSIYQKGTGLLIKEFVSDKKTEKRQEYADNRYNLMMDHINSIPSEPEGIEQYCNEYVFKNRYIVLKKGRKGKDSQLKCLACGKTFTSKDRPKHKSQSICPECGSEATIIAERYVSSIKDKTKMLIMYKVNGFVHKEWTNVERRYKAEGLSEQYHFEPYFYEIDTEKRAYMYHYVSMYYFNGFARTKWRCSDRVHVYAGNIKDMFNNGWLYKMNLERLRYAGKIDLYRLFKNATEFSTTWQLYKIGLYQLAEKADLLPGGKTFEEVVGVSKNYLPALKKHNVTLLALKIIKMSDQFLSEETIGKLCKLLEDSGHWQIEDKIEGLLKQMSFIKIVNYFSKQKEIMPKRDLSTLATFYIDYLDMAKQLNGKLSKDKKFDMTTLNFRFPADIKKAHDNISNQLTLRKNRKKELELHRLYRQLIQTHSFSYKELTVVIPRSIEDFIREGNSLDHCVGRGTTYIDSHLKGTGLTFFIRKKENIDKPYYTFTISPKTNTVSQCHGKCHASPTTEINTFINKFLEHVAGEKPEENANVA